MPPVLALEFRSKSQRSTGFFMGSMGISIRLLRSPRFLGRALGFAELDGQSAAIPAVIRANGMKSINSALTIPLQGMVLDADNFRTRANNFFDHNNVGRIQYFHSGYADGGADSRLGIDAAISSAMEKGAAASGLFQSDRRIQRKYHRRTDSHGQHAHPRLRPTGP